MALIENFWQSELKCYLQAFTPLHVCCEVVPVPYGSVKIAILVTQVYVWWMDQIVCLV